MFESYFEKIDIDVLKKNIEYFWNLDFGQVSSKEIKQAYLACFRQGEMTEFPSCYYGIYINKGEKLYRIRKDIKEYSGIKSKQDFSYNPNPKSGELGRFNKDDDKILYLGLSMAVSLEEVGVVSGDRFLFIEYEAINEIPLRAVNISNWFVTDNPIHEEKVKILNGFVNQIMTISTDDNGFAYRLTTLFKDYFPFSIIDEVVGWFYQSTKIKGSNLALIYPKANGYLRVSDFRIVEMQQDGKLLTTTNEKIESKIRQIIDSEIIIM